MAALSLSLSLSFFLSIVEPIGNMVWRNTSWWHYWVLLGFNLDPSLVDWVLVWATWGGLLLGFTGFYWVVTGFLLGFTWWRLGLLGLRLITVVSCCFFSGCLIDNEKVAAEWNGFNGLYWVLLGFTAWLLMVLKGLSLIRVHDNWCLVFYWFNYNVGLRGRDWVVTEFYWVSKPPFHWISFQILMVKNWNLFCGPSAHRVRVRVKKKTKQKLISGIFFFIAIFFLFFHSFFFYGINTPFFLLFFNGRTQLVSVPASINWLMPLLLIAPPAREL